MIQTISFRGDRSPVPPRVKIGFESDNLVESLAFELPELADDQSAMLMINGNAYANMIDLYRTEDGKWAVDLTAEIVGPAGVYESYVAITCPGRRRWNSGVFDLLTGDLPDISESVEALYPTAVEHVLQEMAETRQEMAASVTASEDAAQRAEDAAQRAEDAANQGGGGEAPVKDAVLYTAQELTEEQQTQARENIGAASAEAVGKLSEEKADKKDIPAPYTLPVATADTLGVVKIGEGLVMDGKTLRVIPDWKWELIEATELKESVNAFARDVEPNGTPYNYKAVVVRANFANVVVDYPESTYGFMANRYEIYCYKASRKIGITNSIWGCIDNSGCIPVVNCCVNANTGSSVVDPFTGLINNTYNHTNFQAKPIKDITLNGTLPEGVQISIWGVRA